MVTNTNSNHQAFQKGYVAPAVRLLLLLGTVAFMALLFSPFSASAEKSTWAATASQQAAGTCGFAVTGETDVSGVCN